MTRHTVSHKVVIAFLALCATFAQAALQSSMIAHSPAAATVQSTTAS